MEKTGLEKIYEGMRKFLLAAFEALPPPFGGGGGLVVFPWNFRRRGVSRIWEFGDHRKFRKSRAGIPFAAGFSWKDFGQLQCLFSFIFQCLILKFDFWD